jgi:hypothetical protein
MTTFCIAFYESYLSEDSRDETVQKRIKSDKKGRRKDDRQMTGHDRIVHGRERENRRTGGQEQTDKLRTGQNTVHGRK